MSLSDKPDLTAEQLEQALDLIRKGNRIATVARQFGVARQAFYNRARRTRGVPGGWDELVEQAQAAAETALLGKLADADAGWQRFAWMLERRFGWLSAVDRAKIDALRRGEGDQMQRQRELRAFVEQAMAAAEGDPEAPITSGQPEESEDE